MLGMFMATKNIVGYEYGLALLVLLTFFLWVYLSSSYNLLAWSFLLNGVVVMEYIRCTNGNIKPEYIATWLLVCMYLVLVYIRGASDYLSWAFLFYSGVGYIDRVMETGKMFVWDARAPVKSLGFLGCFLALHVWLLFEVWLMP